MATHTETMSRSAVRVVPGAKRVRGYIGGVNVVDTTRPLYVWEVPYFPQYYFPMSDVAMDQLVPAVNTLHTTGLGDARTFNVVVGGEQRVEAARQYEQSPVEAIRDHIRFEWDAIDAWFEEDEEVYTHPRNPYTRVDILPSSRSVRVELDGTVLAESTHARVLLETGAVPRWYLPKVDVRMDLLERTSEVSQCPYKGEAHYWSARLGERVEENIAWSYRTPLPECVRVAGLVCFYNERVDLFLDGVRQELPRVPFP